MPAAICPAYLHSVQSTSNTVVLLSNAFDYVILFNKLNKFDTIKPIHKKFDFNSLFQF